MCLRCRPSSGADRPPVQRPGVAGPSRSGADGGPAGRDPGRDRVVDALAGHRVDQPAASPASSTGPSGWSHRQPTAAGGAPSSARRRRPSRAAARSSWSSSSARDGGSPVAVVGQQLAVPDVGEPVAAVEGPGVRRLAAVAVADHLGAPAVRRRRRVAADRQRAAAVGQPEVLRGGRSARRPRRPRPGARNRPSSTTPWSVTRTSPTRCRTSVGARGDRALDQPGVEDLARDDVDRPGHRSRRPTSSPRASSSRVSGVQPSSTPVTPIAAERLEARAGRCRRRRTCRAGSRTGRAAAPAGAGSACSAAERGRRAGRAGAHDDEVPVGARCVIGPTPASPRRPAPSRSRPGTASGRCANSATTARPAVDDQGDDRDHRGVDRRTDHDHHRGRDEHRGRDHLAPARAEPVRQARGRRWPRRRRGRAAR